MQHHVQQRVQEIYSNCFNSEAHDHHTKGCVESNAPNVAHSSTSFGSWHTLNPIFVYLL